MDRPEREDPDASDTPEGVPGPLAAEKRSDIQAAGRPQPEAAEVESARILANQARESLTAAGLSDARIQQLADDYVALDRGDDLRAFIEWAKEQA